MLLFHIHTGWQSLFIVNRFMTIYVDTTLHERVEITTKMMNTLQKVHT